MKIKVLHNEQEKRVLVSLNRYDYVSSDDGVFIDGGQDGYVRYSLKEGWEFKVIDTSEIHQELCEFFKWGANYDKNGNLLPETKFRPICQLETDHIENILKTQKQINKFLKTVMEQELKNRKIMGNKVKNVTIDLTGTERLFLNNTSFKSEKLIGKFNNTSNENIDKIKKLSSELVDLINDLKGDEEFKKLALINIAQGQMWAVKSLF